MGLTPLCNQCYANCMASRYCEPGDCLGFVASYGLCKCKTCNPNPGSNMETTAARIADRAKALAPNEAISPGTIIAIITSLIPMILNLFKSCPQPPTPPPVPPTPKETVAMLGTFKGIRRLHEAMRQNDIHPLTPKGQAIQAACLAEVKEISDTDAAEVMAEFQ